MSYVKPYDNKPSQISVPGEFFPQTDRHRAPWCAFAGGNGLQGSIETKGFSVMAKAKPYEITCPACMGKSVFPEKNIAPSPYCEKCHRQGVILTDQGKELLAFIGKRVMLGNYGDVPRIVIDNR